MFFHDWICTRNDCTQVLSVKRIKIVCAVGLLVAQFVCWSVINETTLEISDSKMFPWWFLPLAFSRLRKSLRWVAMVFSAACSLAVRVWTS